LIPLLFDATVLDLFTEENRKNVHKTLEDITDSYHTACRTVVDFTLVFKFNGTLPQGHDTALDPFCRIVAAVADLQGADSQKREVATGISVSARFPNCPDVEFLSVRRGEHPTLRKFAVCLALAGVSRSENEKAGIGRRMSGIALVFRIYHAFGQSMAGSA
jgi:hypothetical protein